MANQIDQFNYYDPLTQKGDRISDVWSAQLSAHIDTLNGYLSPFGIFLPILTTAQRNSIQAPVEGQIIYNIDAIAGPPRTGELQVWQVKLNVGAWRTITTVP